MKAIELEKEYRSQTDDSLLCKKEEEILQMAKNLSKDYADIQGITSLPLALNWFFSYITRFKR